MALDPGPGLIGAIFGKTKTKPVEKSPTLGRSIETTIGRLDPYRAAQDLSLADYTKALQGIGGEVGRLSKEDIGTYGNLINQGVNYSPQAGYQGIGDYLTGLVDKRADLFAGLNRGALNLARANIWGGQGEGTATGSFDKQLMWNNIARNLAPVYQQAIAGITPGFQATAADRYQNLGNVVNLMGQRAQVPFRTADLALMPAEARSRFLQNEIAALGGLGGAVGQNIAGFQSEDNTAKRITDVLNQSQNDATDLAMKAAATYFGGGAGGAAGMMGGGGGGGLGGLFAGAGGGAGAQGWQGPPPQGTVPYWQMPYNMNPRQTMPYYGNPYANPYYNPYAPPQPTLGPTPQTTPDNYNWLFGQS